MHTGESLAGAFGLGADERRTRLLGLALLASLVLHALILLFLSVFRDSMQGRLEPPPLTAHLAKPRPPPEPPRVEPPPQLAASRPVARAPRPSPAPIAPASSVLAVEPAPQSAQPPAFVVTPAAPAPAAKLEAATASAQSGPDPASIARYRLELLTKAREYERYPRIALDNNWEGQVGLRIQIAEGGRLTAVAVVKSSGRPILDEQAQSMIRSAHPYVILPTSLSGNAFGMDVYINFKVLKEAR